MKVRLTRLRKNGTTMINTRKAFPSPFEEYTCHVLPDWIDANGHMNIAFYGIVFDRGNYAACDALGLGEDYVERAHHGVFAAETHILYFRELHLGELISVRTQIVSADDKRLHFAHEIYRHESSERAAAQEIMYLHVNLQTRRVVPFLDDVRDGIAEAAKAHEQLPIPEWCGRRISSTRTPSTLSLGGASTP
jgi:acyl-CoA thioester hydrolase